MRASDRPGAPEGSRVSTARVTVFVPRDQNPPRFEERTYNRKLSENAEVNSTVLTVKAFDNDLVVSTQTSMSKMTQLNDTDGSSWNMRDLLQCGR